MQWRAAIWITGAFCTSPTEGIETITGLIPIALYLCKLNSRHHLCYTSILSLHAINLLLNTQHAKNHPPHRFTISKLTVKQQMNLKSPIKDVNKCLNNINKCFNSLYSIFSPGSRVVDYFSSRITFYSPPSSSNDNFHHHLQKLNYAFNLSQILSHSAAVISNSGIKKSHTASVAAHIWVNNFIVKQLQLQSTNVISVRGHLHFHP